MFRRGLSLNGQAVATLRRSSPIVYSRRCNHKSSVSEERASVDAIKDHTNSESVKNPVLSEDASGDAQRRREYKSKVLNDPNAPASSILDLPEVFLGLNQDQWRRVIIIGTFLTCSAIMYLTSKQPPGYYDFLLTVSETCKK